jgi:ribonuclease HI
MRNITAFSDGGCSGNPGPGGWAVLIDGVLHSGRIDRVITNNYAELYAIHQVIELSPPDSYITLYTDSRVAMNLFKHGGRTMHRHLADQVIESMALASSKRQTLHLKKCKGHADAIENNKVDGAARAQARIARKLSLAAQEDA